ncbi:MAG: RNA methyltransferase [Candidatus Shikimatogenerans sp. JK-2022]|nr:RNA methyltransferase [Candidatus Shikimatogenerans bostrichidophilus]
MLSIKNIKKLHKSKKERIKKKLFIVEGYKEFFMALKGNFKLKEILICKNIFIKKKFKFFFLKKYIFYINKKIYKKISYRNNTEGIIGIFYIKKINYKKKLINIIKKKKFIILINDNIEKPGNLGAIIRTLETTNIINCIILIYDNFKDIYNPNIIRSSLGSIFIFPIIIISFNKLKYIILKYNIKLFGTSINKYNNLNLYKIKFVNYKKIMIIFGNENKGISNKWKNIIYKNINIPMFGIINSLNVSISVAIIIFELLRQKIFI